MEISYSNLVNYNVADTGYFPIYPTGLNSPLAAISLQISDSVIDYRSNIPIDVVEGLVNLDLNAAISGLEPKTGRYTCNVQLYTSLLTQGGDNVSTSLVNLSRISNSRTEIKINLPFDISNQAYYDLESALFRRFSADTSNDNEWARNYNNAFYVNGTFYSILNAKIAARGTVLTLKLDKPLDDSVVPGVNFDIVSIGVPLVSYDIEIVTREPAPTGTPIAPPDFTIKHDKLDPQSTDYLSYTALTTGSGMSMGSSTVQQILNTALSGSGVVSADLGIDYRLFKSFVHFGSAKERLDNFKYKMQLLEYYSSSIGTLNNVVSSGSYHSSKNVTLYTQKSDAIVTGFDDYERHLYFSSHSTETSSMGYFYQSTWPKTNSTYPYTNATVDSTLATQWFATRSLDAIDYDQDNDHSLEKAIPLHVRIDTSNAPYLTFVNMIGQHFDQVWTYVDHINRLYNRNEKLDVGLSKDVVYHALSSLGWEPQSGYSIDDLWSYYAGTPFTASGYTVNADSNQIPTADVTKEIWNRTINNLPHLLKTRGTERGIKALLATYGMPNSLLQIVEYGGKSKVQTANTYRTYQKFNRSIRMRTGSAIQCPVGALTQSYDSRSPAPDGYELRINPKLINTTNPQTASCLISTPYWGLTLEPHISAANANSSMSNHGQLHLYYSKVSQSNASSNMLSASSPFLPFFDNDWYNIQVTRAGVDAKRKNDSGADWLLKASAQKSAEYSNAKITHTASCEITVPAGASQNENNGNWNMEYGAPGSHTYEKAVTIGTSSFGFSYGTTTRPSGISGSIQEFRSWFHTDVSAPHYTALASDAYDNHTLSPLSIEGNSYTASFTDLITRYTFGTDNVVADIGTGNSFISSSHLYPTHPFGPGSGSTTLTATASGFTGVETSDYAYEEETYYTCMPDIAGNTAISDKIRIAPANSATELYQNSSSVSSSLNLAGPDSALVGVYFSPTHEIDLDMAHEIGGTSFDDFVGNPRDRYRGEYAELRNIRNYYWKKYNNRLTFAAYMNVLKYFDKSLFKQIDKMLPARSIKQVGLLVAPTLLERNTVKQYSESMQNVSYGNNTAASVPNIVRATGSVPIQTLALADDPDPTGRFNGAIIADIDATSIFGYDYSYEGTRIHPSSFVTSNTGYYRIGDTISLDVPVYYSGRKSILKKRIQYTTDATGSFVSRSLVEAEVQDYTPLAIQNLQYNGCKLGTIAGSIGGIISYASSDPTITFEGLMPNIKAAIEVVETNPNTPVVQTNGPSITAPEITIR